MHRLLAPLLLLLAVGGLGVFLRHHPRPPLDLEAAAVVDALGVPAGFLNAVSDALGGWVGWVVAAGLACLLAVRRGVRAGLLTLAAFATTHGVSSFAKVLFDRARPEDGVLGGGTSYPSGHVAVATTLVAVGVLPWLTAPAARGRALALVAVLAGAGLMGLSRMGLHRHFLTDVVGGAGLGLAVVLALSLAWSPVLPDRRPGPR